ncbi:MAG: biotin--[acetyl-CoA-carboxylase] ligase [Bacteroidales bacterium]|nr:biotin--[acetyl-CoA-carboxylase] ligase [Bacteroidales bacterium]MDG1901945.1 biotin--[acetyl-CoA-carboxylase] ligase [Bacteroidales bacterium]MDG2081090.1 biotin--[acetyl-CoA-carboxylase] ligase [Bacteroidales bacterium]|tara:strand:+ start:25169 stop:25912 length:744 start_codon:yes stop_codon:yes gene_type:complete
MDINIINIIEADSTNSHAIGLIENGKANEGDVVVTSCQKQGKGQGENHWESEPNKNITATLILEPTFIHPSQQFVLTQLISLSIKRILDKYLSNYNTNTSVKWPNDIYIGDKKIAGILFQNFVVGETLTYSVIGFGVNINQTKFSVKAGNPIALIELLKDDVNVNDILKEVLEDFKNSYESIREYQDYNNVNEEYIDNLFLRGAWHKFKDINGSFIGKISGVDEFGRLEVITRSGNSRVYLFKEITF